MALRAVPAGSSRSWRSLPTPHVEIEPAVLGEGRIVVETQHLERLWLDDLRLQLTVRRLPPALKLHDLDGGDTGNLERRLDQLRQVQRVSEAEIVRIEERRKVVVGSRPQALQQSRLHVGRE